MKKIYLDYSATTPLDPAVLKKMLPYFAQRFANPASIHSDGQAALRAVEDVRHEIAQLLECKATELIFSSGATESNNLALRGVLNVLKKKGDKRKTIITTAIEHSSILEPLGRLAEEGYTIIKTPVDANGKVKISKLQEAITNQTALITIGYVNSETGTIQEIDRIGRAIKNINERHYKEWLKLPARKRGARPQPIYFHCDATQAFTTQVCSAQKLKVDLMSLSGHKLYGPKGIGLLFVKKDTPFEALVYGGHQERNLRSGTLNVPAIIGLAEAMKISDKLRTKFNSQVSKIRNTFVKEVVKLTKKAKLSVPLEYISSFHANVIFPEVLGDALLAELDEAGVEASAGSACASGDLEASPVLRALGYSEEQANSALRFTFGRNTSLAEAKTAAKRAAAAYKKCLARG